MGEGGRWVRGWGRQVGHVGRQAAGRKTVGGASRQAGRYVGQVGR